MATQVLTAVGGIVGGPVGAAIGGLIGQSVDRGVLFAPPARQGPRLTELAVQTSSYGTPIPKLFGTMRVAGTVIWSTDLIETETEDEGGKGAPDSVRYSYSVSFAVLLSARAIRGVGRIWADGKLLRGAAGDFKSACSFRLHNGGEDQPPDPLIAAAHGIGAVPAQRGCAYAVFEDLALADYANRIPSLTFEVEADTGAIDAGAIVAELSGGAVGSQGAVLPLGGFSAHGGSQRAVFEALAEASGGWFAPEAAGLVLCAGEGASRDVGDAGIGGAHAVRARAIEPADRAPRIVTVRHYDAARDYQAGVQRATRPGAGSRSEAIDLPAVVSASAAKAIAEATMARADRDRERRTLLPGNAALDVRPGDRVTIAGEEGQWRVRRFALETMAVTLELSRLTRAPSAAAAAASGSFVAPRDAVHGPTRIEAFELAPVGTEAASAPTIAIAAAGEGQGWRRAALILSSDSGASWQAIGATRGAAVIGTVLAPPGAASAMIEDHVHAIEVELAHPGMQLAGADAVRIDQGANLALVGRELIQFGTVEAMTPTRWRLTRLWRGRRGSEREIAAHAAGERFVLIEPQRVLTLPVSTAAIGQQLRVAASGIGDGVGAAEAIVAIDGRSLLPLAPVHPSIERHGDGSATLRWVRRSRIGWRWSDGVDAPIGEERERYRIAVTVPGSPAAEIDTEAPQLTLDPQQAAAQTLVALRQVGTHGPSPANMFALGALSGDQG
ncbi:phage tail baseplate protein [Sphingomonas japonica]|uniref:Tip attachment protein J domain-containing protein n=1 Tax=Sphingomonas japonica TaxID=511662 RepID=A0ABX0TZQ6_9SPHN|nr:phage tail protein [Sphingomonas japonica]NIJ23739.1 hypothetical protein [Sphingomonas japonica]